MEFNQDFVNTLKKAFVADITPIIESGDIQSILNYVSKAKHTGFYIPNFDGSPDYTLNPDPINITINNEIKDIYRYDFPTVEYPDVPNEINDTEIPVSFMDYLSRRIGNNFLAIKMLRDENIQFKI